MRLLVVYKQSFLETHHGNRPLLSRLAPEERTRLLRADIENRQAVRDVEQFLKSRKLPYDLVYRGSLAASPRYDLIVTVGGDGTFFTAAHYSHRAPIFGINSDPKNSLGIFTCSDRHSFSGKLVRALAGRLPKTKLNRLEVIINRKPIRELVLNDMLFAHRTPASMSRYEVTVDGRKEIQRSSGMWISTAAGSTSAVRAAGGWRMAIGSKRVEYRTREPYNWPVPRYKLAEGEARRAIGLRVMMNEAALWIDGARFRIDLGLDDRIEIRTGAEPATVLGFDRRRRDRLFP